MKRGRKPEARGLAKAAGQKTYFTGHPCPRGHIAWRLVSNWTCVACLREKTNERLADQPDYRRKENERVRQHRLQNLQQDAGRHARWKKDNPEKITLYNHRKRALIENAEGSYSILEARYLLIWQGYVCANPSCCADLRVVKKHLDHKTPLSRGGSNSIENLQWLCEPCNCRKWKYTQDEWLVLQRQRAA